MRNAMKSIPIIVQLPPPAHEALKQITGKGVLSDVVRDALRPVFEAHGYDPALLDIERGGNRHKPKRK